MKTCEVHILNALGMHARAAAKFVHTAGGFAARIRVGRGDREVDGKSIMGLLLLAAARACMPSEFWIAISQPFIASPRE